MQSVVGELSGMSGTFASVSPRRGNRGSSNLNLGHLGSLAEGGDDDEDGSSDEEEYFDPTSIVSQVDTLMQDIKRKDEEIAQLQQASAETDVGLRREVLDAEEKAR